MKSLQVLCAVGYIIILVCFTIDDVLTFSSVYISMQFSSTRRCADVCSVDDVYSSCLIAIADIVL